MKTCTKCKIEKPFSDFYRCKATKDGVQFYCKECCKEYKLKNREAIKTYQRKYHREYYYRDIVANRERQRERNRARLPCRSRNQFYTRDINYKDVSELKTWRTPEKNKARTCSKKLLRPDKCEQCGKECKPHGHHPDYSKPKEVVWLCVSCHGKTRRLEY